MFDLSSILMAGFVGLLSGFLVSIPVGPINVTIINEGARRGVRWGLLIGWGAVTMEVIYCAIGFASFSSLFDNKMFKATMELISFVIMVFLGFKYLTAKTVEEHSRSADKIEEKLHPHSAFMTGFIRVLGNPAVLVFWMTIAAAFTSHDWVETSWSSRGACILGVGLGAAAWFVLLSFMVARSHHRFTTKNLLLMSHISGASLLLVGMIIGFKMIKMLSRH